MYSRSVSLIDVFAYVFKFSKLELLRYHMVCTWVEASIDFANDTGPASYHGVSYVSVKNGRAVFPPLGSTDDGESLKRALDPESCRIF